MRGAADDPVPSPAGEARTAGETGPEAVVGIDRLFRQAAVENAHRRLDGQVILVQSTPSSMLVWTVALLIVVAMVFAASFSYSTYERVTGVLKSTGGELKVYPNTAAVIETLHVRQGQLVKAGQPLAVLRGDEKADRGGSEKELQRNELERQLANLTDNKRRAEEESRFQLEKLRLALENARMRAVTQARQLELLQKQLGIDQATLAARETMKGAGYVSALDLEAARGAVLKTEERLLQLQAEQSETASLIARSQADIDALPGQLSRQIATIDNDMSTLQRQLIQLNAQIEHTLLARQDGRVGNIVALEGELVQPQFPLLTLTAPDAELVAELYVTSRSRAFIREGLDVHVRFESFPSEHYGDIRATIIEVSDVMLFPEDWPNPMKIPRPVYKIIARLDQQFMRVNGEEVSLQQGLPVDADIILERRTILEHLLSPILKVKGSLH